MSDDSQPATEHSGWDEAEVWENIEHAGELIDQGREGEVPPQVLDDYRATQKRVDSQIRPMAFDFMERFGSQLSQVAATRSGARALASRAARSIVQPEDLISEHKAHALHIPVPDNEAISESFAEAQTERTEREEQAAARAELTNERLSDLAYIMTQVERSNASTVQALKEIQEARRAAERAGKHQFLINLGLVLVTSVAAIFGPVVLRSLGLG